MDAIALLRWFLLAQALVALVWALRPLLDGDPASAVRWGRRLVVLAFVAPLLAPWLPGRAPYEPPAQVWAPVAAGGRAALVVPALEVAARPVDVSTAGDLTAAALILAASLAAVLLGRAAWGLRRVLAATLPYKRIGRVRVVVGAATTVPFAARTPLGAWVVLDPDTFADPARRLLAVRHELQHHRHGDAAWAWALVALGVGAPGNPFLGSLRRWLADREELAVDAALVQRGVPVRAYADILVRAAERALDGAPSPCPGLLPGPSRPLLVRRIDMLLRPTPRRRTLLPLLAVPLLVTAAWAGDRAVADRRVDRDEVAGVAERLAADTDFPVVANDLVLARLDALVGTPGGRKFVQGGLAARGEWGPYVDRALAEAGLPAELAAIPLVESGYRVLDEKSGAPSAAPGFRGAGLWMFIPSTARAYGLRVDAEVDERLDVPKETAAAIALLSDLHAELGDWPLALAAYNQGERHVRSAIAAEGTRDAWELQRRGALNDYAATVMAAVLVLEEPSLAD